MKFKIELIIDVEEAYEFFNEETHQSDIEILKKEEILKILKSQDFRIGEDVASDINYKIIDSKIESIEETTPYDK